MKQKLIIDLQAAHLDILQQCGGYYACRKDASKRRLSPLVGYAGKYLDQNGNPKQWVGEVYANFAKVDEYSHVVQHFADQSVSRFGKSHINSVVDALCGMPIGGYSFSQALSLTLECPVIKAEKKVVVLTTEVSREQSELVFARHTIEKGARYGIVEDVCNNYSTTEQAVKLIDSLGGKVAAIFCILNRSPLVNHLYHPQCIQGGVPIFSLVYQAMEQYKQDDPFVAEDVAKGNVVWKPKDEWERLVSSM